MRITSLEEYGLRCLVQVARQQGADPVGIPDIARAEGLSVAYAAKLMRLLRQGGLVTSVRGANGGYFLARPATAISIWQVLVALDGKLYPAGFCEQHAADKQGCGASSDCSLRTLWCWTDEVMADVMGRITLADVERRSPSLTQTLQSIRIPANADTRAAS